MLAGVNDSYEQAVALAELLGRDVFKVNLIPYNPTGTIYEGSSREAIAPFRAVLEEHGVPVDRPPHTRARHRRRLRPARRGAAPSRLPFRRRWCGRLLLR